MFTRIVNQLGYRSSPMFENLFTQENFELQDILDDENVVNEFRNKNEKLQNYLNQDKLKQLIDYIIYMPVNQIDELKANKHAFYASEILSQEQQFIWDNFFPTVNEEIKDIQQEKINSSLLDHLFTFLDNNEEINEVLSGYWGQVIQNLFVKKAQQLTEYIYERPQIIKNMLHQLQSRSVADVVLKIVAIEFSMTDQMMIQKRYKLIDDIIKLAVTKELKTGIFEALDNIAYIFSEFIKDHKTIQDGEDLMNYIIQTVRITLLVESAMSLDKNISLCSSSILSNITSTMINNKNNDDLKIDQNALMSIFIEKFDLLMDFLQTDCHQSFVKGQNGQDLKPFGQGKLKLLEAMCNLLKPQNEEYFQKFAQQKTLQILIKTLQKYPWNNIMHHIVMKIFKTIFKQGESFEIDIPQHELIEELLAATAVTTEGNYRKGFLGFVTEIGQSFEKYLGTHYEDFRFDKPEEWVQFEEQFYIEAKKQIRKQLGNFGSKKNSVDFAGFKLIDVQNLIVQSDANEEDKQSISSSSSEEPQPKGIEEEEQPQKIEAGIEADTEVESEAEKVEEEKEIKEEDFDYDQEDESNMRSRRR